MGQETEAAQSERRARARAGPRLPRDALGSWQSRPWTPLSSQDGQVSTAAQGRVLRPGVQGLGGAAGSPPNMTESWFPCLTDTGPLHRLPLGSARAPCLVPSLLLALTWCSFRVALRAVIWGLSWCCWVRGAPARAVLTHSSLVIGDNGCIRWRPPRRHRQAREPPGAGCTVRSAAPPWRLAS